MQKREGESVVDQGIPATMEYATEHLYSPAYTGEGNVQAHVFCPHLTMRAAPGLLSSDSDTAAIEKAPSFVMGCIAINWQAAFQSAVPFRGARRPGWRRR